MYSFEDFNHDLDDKNDELKKNLAEKERVKNYLTYFSWLIHSLINGIASSC